MTHNTIAELVERLALPPDGVDLRAELDALQSARVSQALDQSGGDVTEAARLLRMSRRDLSELAARFAMLPELEAPSGVPRIERGVEFISAAIIRRYYDEGLTEKQIASRLACNVFLIEKVLRSHTRAEVLRLDAEGYDVDQIASAVRVPRERVRLILKRPGPSRARAVSKAASKAVAP